MSDVKQIAGTRIIEITTDKTKGRCLTAKVDLELGRTILSEASFSAMLATDEKNDAKFCGYCFKTISVLFMCQGCVKENYCSEECRRLSWKSYHWFECFMQSILLKMSSEVRMALRILLNASHSMFGDGKDECDPLHKITEEICHSTTKSVSKRDSFQSDYWSIYSLQRHEKEQTMDDLFSTNILDIRTLTRLALKCIDMKDKFKVILEISNKNGCDLFIHSFFKKLSFYQYYSMEKFDILSWRSHVLESCESVLKTKGYFPPVSLKDMFTRKPLTEQDLLERLLVHHVLQTRTNQQAIFKVCQSNSASNLQTTEQKRLASAVFSVTSLMNHSCEPNVAVSFEGRTIVVKAIKFIKRGEEIEHCYGPHYARHDVHQRQKILKDQYFFNCSCTHCIAELKGDEMTSFRLQFQAFKCNHCGDPLRNEKTPSDSLSKIATCINEGCSRKQELSKYHTAHKNFQDLHADACNLVDNGDVDNAMRKLQECLEIGQNVLYHNHVDIGAVHDKIAQCFVMRDDYSSSIPHLTKSIAIIGMRYGTQSVEIAHELQKLASSYFNLSNFEQAGKYAKKVLTIYKTNFSSGTLLPGTKDMEQIIKLCNLK